MTPDLDCTLIQGLSLKSWHFLSEMYFLELGDRQDCRRDFDGRWKTTGLLRGYYAVGRRVGEKIILDSRRFIAGTPAFRSGGAEVCLTGTIRTGGRVDRRGENRADQGGRRAGESRGENRGEAVWIVQPGFDPSRWEVSSVR